MKIFRGGNVPPMPPPMIVTIISNTLNRNRNPKRRNRNKEIEIHLYSYYILHTLSICSLVIMRNGINGIMGIKGDDGKCDVIFNVAGHQLCHSFKEAVTAMSMDRERDSHILYKISL